MSEIINAKTNDNLIPYESVIKDAKTIIFPTDTVYGLGCRLKDSDSIEKIYEIKNRPQNKAIIILFKDKDQIHQYFPNIDERASILIDKFMPGGLTVIVNTNENIPPSITRGLKTIGIRIPNNDIARNLISLLGPLPTTSANVSGDSSNVTAENIFKTIGDKVDILIDGGETKNKIESTIVDCSNSKLEILREGAIKTETIFNVLNLN